MTKRILLIDDDEDEMYFFTEALNEANCSFACLYANSVEEGLKMLNNKLPDYVFLDINMPKINGFEALSRIRNLEHTRHVSVILYSTAISEEVVKKGLAKGATACMRKTGSIESLAESLKILLDQNPSLPVENNVSFT